MCEHQPSTDSSAASSLALSKRVAVIVRDGDEGQRVGRLRPKRAARQKQRRLWRLGMLLGIGSCCLWRGGQPANAQQPPAWFVEQYPAANTSLGTPRQPATAVYPSSPSQPGSMLQPSLPTQSRQLPPVQAMAPGQVLPPSQPAPPSQVLPQVRPLPPVKPLDTVQFDSVLPMNVLPMSGAMGFAPTTTILEADWKSVANAEEVYDDRYPVPVQRPWIEWGRPFYGDGMLPPGGTIFSKFNLTHPSFYLYGDYRMGVGSGRNELGRADNLAARLNLEMDLAITSTERFHAFVGPLNNVGQFSQVGLQDGRLEFEPVFNPNLVTGFFEGDLGYMLGGISDVPAEFDMPIAAGLIPLFYQNGIWMDDAVTGIAVAQNAKHSRLLKWSNFDATAFAIFDELNSPAFGQDNHAGQALGTAWFIEAYGGYIETGYAYVYDRMGLGRTYHNATVSFTRRYFDRIGNSVRLIVNAGQQLEKSDRTADGGVLLVESNWITASPLTVVPYCNLFYGWGRPQSLARNGLAGGILRNVGINFETDGLNGFPTLDPTAINTFGGAIGVNLIGASLERQLVLEAAIVQAYGAAANRVTLGNQYGLGARYQMPLSHRTILRFDTMMGWREHDRNVYGGRVEFRYKF